MGNDSRINSRLKPVLLFRGLSLSAAGRSAVAGATFTWKKLQGTPDSPATLPKGTGKTRATAFYANKAKQKCATFV